MLVRSTESAKHPSKIHGRKESWVSWGTGSNCVKKDEEFVRHTWEFLHNGPKRGVTLAAGNYEWPFDYLLPGYTPESVEGLQDSWIIYRLKATIERGVLAQNVFARKHVRAVRTLDTAALELSHEMSVENTWVDKIDYHLSTPTKAVIFGTAIQVDFRIAPLLKGLRIGEVTTKIHERQDIMIDMRKHVKEWKVTRDIAEDKFDFPQDQETTLVDGQDSWVFTRQIHLPKSLRECLQTVDVLGIRTKHSLLFNVKLINPDEHVSEVTNTDHLLQTKLMTGKLHASLPLYIYISPNLLVDEDNNVVTCNLGGMDPGAFGVGAPPVYGEHQLDLLYSGLDSAGYVTPAGGMSGIGTPFNSQSRRGSADNLASINGMASSGVPPTALQSRLGSLYNRPDVHLPASHIAAISSPADDPGIPTNQQNGSNHDGNQQRPNDDPLSRRTSEPDSEHSSTGQQHLEFSPEQLSKVPSYSTALRSQTQTAISEVPPTYQSVTQRSAT
ncbi:MAG: hypothetical protein Q9208_003832 [Pyrenodesmia sp. 3 TL-2023]